MPSPRSPPEQVFCELERVLDTELDFRAEAQAMEKIAAGVAHTVDGKRAKPPVVVPRPVPGLCSRRVLVMEYVQVTSWETRVFAPQGCVRSLPSRLHPKEGVNPHSVALGRRFVCPPRIFGAVIGSTRSLPELNGPY